MALLLDYYKSMILPKIFHRPDLCFGTASIGILRQHNLAKLLNARISVLRKDVSGVVGWGAKPNTHKAKKYAQKHNLPFFALEDGFLRSYGTGDLFPTLSLIIDDIGIYYDSTKPSALENLLNADLKIIKNENESIFAHEAKQIIVGENLSKYNHSPNDESIQGCSKNTSRILVVDQTFGDMGVTLAAANAKTFEMMLEAALDENPHAEVYIKTHPETTSGRKRGYFSETKYRDKRLIKISHLCNPLSLIKKMDHIYVVSSTMGFEALLLNKKVTCFGIPWYSGWGVTSDNIKTSRRIKNRSVDELFYAAYIEYTRYLNPNTHKIGSIFDVMNWLILQKRMNSRFNNTTK